MHDAYDTPLPKCVMKLQAYISVLVIITLCFAINVTERLGNAATPELDPNISEPSKDPRGNLEIEGTGITRLVLRLADGERKVFNNPETLIQVPVGRHEVSEIRLKGGVVYYALRQSDPPLRVSIDSTDTAVLKAGMPLTHTIDVERQGRTLVLDYKLRGPSREVYTPEGIGKAPRVTIFRGAEAIHTGRFAFG